MKKSFRVVLIQRAAMVLLSIQTVTAQQSTSPQQPTVPPILTSKAVRILPSLEPINTESIDYAPFISNDGTTLYFVSDRPGSLPFISNDAATQASGGSARNSKNNSHDVWVGLKHTPYDSTFYKVQSIDSLPAFGNTGINTTAHEGNVAISADGTTMFVVRCNNGGYGDCDIFMSTRNADGTWGTLFNPGPAINTEHWESQPSITSDFRRLYFASNRPGSIPVEEALKPKPPQSPYSTDIWYSDYDPVSKTFQPAVNAGKTINTAGNEWSPFICANNQTLIFASNGHPSSLGGLDIYYTTAEANGNWTTPVHLEEPFNSSKNDAFMTVAPSGDILYFSSVRTDLPHRGSYDIYMAVDDNILHRSATLIFGKSASGMRIVLTNNREETVRELSPETQEQIDNTFSIQWDTTDSSGIKVPTGNYTYTLLLDGKIIEQHTLTVK